MKNFGNICIKLFEDAITVFLVIIELFIVLQVIARYVLHIAIPWTEEMSRYLIVLVGFAGGVLVSRRGEHLGAYFLRDQMKGRVKSGLYIVNSVICTIYFFATGYGAWIMFGKMSPRMTTSTVEWMQIRWLYIFLVIGSFGMMAYAIRDVAHSIHAYRNRIEITRAGRSSPFPKED